MKKIIENILGAQLAGLLAAAALAGPAGAGQEIPFKGDLKGSFTITPLDPPSAAVVIEASGNAAHLGLFSVEIPHEVSFATFTGAGTYEFTAANGDTLTADFTGIAVPTADPNILLIEEFAVITGGTGRFAGASGSFICARKAVLSGPTAGVTEGEFSGAIILAKRK